MAGKAWTWHRWGARRVAGFVWSPDRRLPKATGRHRLTARQLEVLRARFRCGSRKEAAAALGIVNDLVNPVVVAAVFGIALVHGLWVELDRRALERDVRPTPDLAKALRS